MNCVTALLIFGLGGGILPFDPSGMGDLAAKLRAEPRVHVQSFTHDADDAMAEYARSFAWRCHLVFVGHSAGANAAVRVAHRLLPEAIPIALLFAFDPPDRAVLPLPPLPANVEVGVFYRQDGVLGGGSIKRTRNYLTASLSSVTVKVDHIPMPRHFAPFVLRDVRWLAGARGRMPR